MPMTSPKHVPGNAPTGPTAEALDTALVALLMMADLHNKPADAAQLQHLVGAGARAPSGTAGRQGAVALAP